jgi:beta-phosphoglucomutase-like phosphatase (HAD superfamily)
MFLEAARQLGMQPEQAVVIEDAAAGVRAAGLPGAMFPWQSGSDGRDETPTQLST